MNSKESRKRYRESDKGKASKRRYYQSDKGKKRYAIANKKWYDKNGKEYANKYYHKNRERLLEYIKTRAKNKNEKI